MPGSTSPTLLSLPLEIRHEIYSQLSSLHATDLAQRIGHEPVHWRHLPYWLDPPFDLSLSLCCRQVYHEYRDHFFRRSALKSIARIYNNDVQPLALKAPVGLRGHVTRCQITFSWKPGLNVIYLKPLEVLEEQLTEWLAELPSLKFLDVDLRYFDIHDLEIDIRQKRFQVGDFSQLQGRVKGMLRGGDAMLQLSAITSFLVKDTRRGLGLGYEEGSLDWILLAESYVCWRLKESRKEDRALSWYGFMPEPCAFYCYGLEAGSMEDLREVVRDALEDDD